VSTAAVSTAAVSTDTPVSAAFVAAFATLAAAFAGTVEVAVAAAFAGTVEVAVAAVFMEALVEASIGEVSVKEDAAAIVVAPVGRPVIRTASCQCQARNDQASNDRLAAARCRPPREAARVRGGESRFKKRGFHD
jgi:hypothetical protein